jgi:putative SOS response-associated peptidase YedK
MCNLYVPPSYERLGKPNMKGLWGSYVAPLKPGPYMRGNGDITVGQWGMIPRYCKTRRPAARNGMPINTNNARRERLATAETFKGPWAAGQRCLIPALTFDEPYYPAGSDKSIAWRFGRADDELWALAGLWAEWTDPATDEVVPSFTLVTQNCDCHALLSLMHKPDKRLPADAQDKRAVVPIERDRWDQWLNGTIEQAEALIQMPPLEVFRHCAVDLAKNIPLPGAARNTQVNTQREGLF